MGYTVVAAYFYWVYWQKSLIFHTYFSKTLEFQVSFNRVIAFK